MTELTLPGLHTKKSQLGRENNQLQVQCARGVTRTNLAFLHMALETSTNEANAHLVT